MQSEMAAFFDLSKKEKYGIERIIDTIWVIISIMVLKTLIGRRWS